LKQPPHPCSPSVHLTLTVEVEPAMEAVGLVHAAVRQEYSRYPFSA
jgi:hypothetical protein